MDLEARSLQNPAVKTRLLSKLRDYKAEMQRLKRERSGGVTANAAADRSQLLAGAQLDDMNAPTSQSQRDRMLQTTARLDQTEIASARASGPARDGRTRREHPPGSPPSARDYHQRAREYPWGRRQHREEPEDPRGDGAAGHGNKLMMYGIIAMLVTAISVIAYFKLIK